MCALHKSFWRTLPRCTPCCSPSLGFGHRVAIHVQVFCWHNFLVNLAAAMSLTSSCHLLPHSSGIIVRKGSRKSPRRWRRDGLNMAFLFHHCFCTWRVLACRMRLCPEHLFAARSRPSHQPRSHGTGPRPSTALRQRGLGLAIRP